jgi:glycosyltransferase involved in cell wall biosynthesis
MAGKNLSITFLAGTLGRGGAERQLIFMLRALKDAGVSTRVLCLTSGESFESQIRDLGVPIKWVGQQRSRLLRLRTIAATIAEEPPDILQGVHFYTNLYVGVASRLCGMKSIGAIRSDLRSEIKVNGIAGHGHFRSPHFLITNSALSRAHAIDAGKNPDRVFFVPNAVNEKELNGKEANGHQEIKLLFVGRLSTEKRPDRFLRVAANVFRCVPDRTIKATLVGDGPLRASLESMAVRMGLQRDRLEFLGVQENIDPFYQQADILISTSDWEGTPNVLLEAMAHGVAIAATKVGGTPEIVTGERGLTVPPDDERGLTNAAIRLVIDQELRMRLARNGRDYISQFHSPAKLQKNLLNTYQTILSH